MSASPDLGCWPTAERDDAILSSVLLVADPHAQEAAADYWDMSRSAHLAVVAAVRALDDADVTGALDDVLASPSEPSRLAELARLVARGSAAGDPAWDRVGRVALQADALGRLAAHLGPEHRPGGPVITAEDLLALSSLAPARPPAPASAPVCVVIPFRDRTPTRSRLRNLLACVRALQDQSADRAAYRVVVVEADTEPRWAREISAVADDYLHLPASGHFNKAWAVNVGVVQRATGAELLCVLDGDVLVDRDFVARNVARFGVRGVQAHLPYRDALCLDEASSSHAIAARVLEGRSESPLAELRGVVLRRPPGHCVWVRRGLFERVGGFDERFEGWGGEDLDLVFRLDVVGAVDRYPDPLLHLFHDRPQTQENGRRFYAGRRLLSWNPVGPVGQLDAPATSHDDDLAGLIEHVDDVPAST